jgi:hypothetical protein
MDTAPLPGRPDEGFTPISRSWKRVATTGVHLTGRAIQGHEQVAKFAKVASTAQGRTPADNPRHGAVPRPSIPRSQSQGRDASLTRQQRPPFADAQPNQLLWTHALRLPTRRRTHSTSSEATGASMLPRWGTLSTPLPGMYRPKLLKHPPSGFAPPFPTPA